MTALVRRQFAAATAGDRGAFLAAWAARSAARQQAAVLYANLRALHVDAREPRVPSDSRASGAAGWVADVDVRWRPSGCDPAFSDAALRFRFSQQDGRARITAVEARPGARTPVWLLPHLVVHRTPHTLVAAGGTDTAARVSRLLTIARADVKDVLPAWRGSLVAYAPATAGAFRALLAAGPHDDDGIAAVTTTVDGSAAGGAAVAIVLNPGAFGRLGPVGAHVVVTHEATHVATQATTTPLPVWLAEGFADYVGIGAAHVSLELATRAAVGSVRHDGVPSALPSDADFAAATGPALEAAYEEAYLATRLISQRYGRAALVSFYDWVRMHPGRSALAFPTVLHVSRSRFTAEWQARLGGLARAA